MVTHEDYHRASVCAGTEAESVASVCHGGWRGAWDAGGGGGVMKLSYFSIKNFRNITSIVLDLKDGNGTPLDAIYIAGDMGIGKTSVLDAIHRALSRGPSFGKESICGRCVVRGRTRTLKTADYKFAYLSQYSSVVCGAEWIRDVKHEHFVAIEAMAHALGWNTWASDCRRGLLTSGQNAIMKMAVPIACAPDPFDVVLIDEPELHLHYSIQTHLMAALRRLSPTTQFIVATNSEAILQMALSYERFIIINDREIYEPSARQAETN